MNDNKLKSARVWFGVNKKNNIQMFLDEEPIKNKELGRYEGKNPFVNSLFYDDLKKIVQNSKLTFESEPQCIEIHVS